MTTVEDMSQRIAAREAAQVNSSDGSGVRSSDLSINDSMEMRILRREMRPGITAAGGGQSWRWQLRDKNGQWIEMGAKVKWFANGMARNGIVMGSPKEGEAEVEESDDQATPAARRTAADCHGQHR